MRRKKKKTTWQQFAKMREKKKIIENSSTPRGLTQEEAQDLPPRPPKQETLLALFADAEVHPLGSFLSTWGDAIIEPFVRMEEKGWIKIKNLPEEKIHLQITLRGLRILKMAGVPTQPLAESVKKKNRRQKRRRKTKPKKEFQPKVIRR